MLHKSWEGRRKGVHAPKKQNDSVLQIKGPWRLAAIRAEENKGEKGLIRTEKASDSFQIGCEGQKKKRFI